MRVVLFLLAAMLPAFATAPVWDNSGDGYLNGAYNFRQVLYISDGSGNINQEIAYFGAITFDGNGNYALSGSNTLLDTGGTLGIPATGTYSVASSGFGFLSNPLLAGQSVYFLVSNRILIGSSTESPGANDSYNNDLFIAAPATPTFTNANFNGAYTMTGYAPGNGTPGAASAWLYQLNPNGTGDITTINASEYIIGEGPGLHGPSTVHDEPYTFSNGAITFSPAGALTAGPPNPYLYTGTYTLYLSPDTNFIFGGSPNGYDIFVGVRAASAAALTSGLYYEIGIDEDASQYVSDQTANIDTYYGVFNAFQSNGTGTILGHERLLYAGSSAEGVAYTTTYPTGSYTGPANVGQLDPSATVQYTIGAGGIRIGFGIGPWLGIEMAFPAPTVSPYLDPTIYLFPAGIVDTASSAPFTAGISPGEFITIYNGINLASTSDCWTAGPPFPTTLAGVQVMIDGIAAPIYCVGPQITVIVPYEVSAYPIASIQVINGTASSNTVTTYVYKTTPGVFTVPAGGLGYAAAQHGDYSLITTTNPAFPEETIVVYLSGLGSVFPVNGVAAVDGAATGPKGDNVVSNIEVDVAGFGSTSIPYAGLTPSTAGLYQINFQVPTNAPAGNDVLAIVGPGSYSAQALLPVELPTFSTVPRAAHPSARKRLPRLTGEPAKRILP